MSFSYFSNLPNVYRIPLIVVAIAVLGTVVVAIFGYVVMWLWNNVLAAVFDIPSVTFWQALGLFFLAKLFFGFGGGSQGGGPRRKRHKKGREPMTDEEVPDTDELFKQYWREEGKQAYEAYLASKGTTGASNDPT